MVRRPKFGASIAATWMDDTEGFRGFASKVILESWVDELGLRPAMTDYFAGRRPGHALAVGIFSNLAWRFVAIESVVR